MRLNDDDDGYEHRRFNRNKQNSLKLHRRQDGEPVGILELDKFICSQPLRRCTTVDCDLTQYLTNFMHKICFTISFISCLYMFRAHVLIIRCCVMQF